MEVRLETQAVHWAKRDVNPREQAAQPCLSLALSGYPLGALATLSRSSTNPPGRQNVTCASSSNFRYKGQGRGKSQGRRLILDLSGMGRTITF